MREIVQDIRDITYSREMYEAKPRPFAAAFIYLLMTFIVVMLIWMSLGTLDIVIKANGYVRPNQQVSTVVNRIAGEVERIQVENGQAIEAGAVLYVVNHEVQDINQKLLQEEVAKSEAEIASLGKYKEAISQDTNLFDPVTEEAYFQKFEKFKLDYLLAENDYHYAEKLVAAKQDSTSSQIQVLESETTYIDALIQSIQQEKTLISGKSETAKYYASRYEKYQLDYDTIAQQYDDQKISIESGKSVEVVAKNLEETKSEHEGYGLLLKSIQLDKSQFTSESQYANLFIQYKSKLLTLQTAYQDSKKNYDLSLSLKGIAVTSSEVDNEKASMDQAFNALENYKMDYLSQVSNHLSDLELKQLELEKGSSNELTKDVILKNNELSKERALEKFTTDTLVNLEEAKTTNQQTLDSLKESSKQLTLEGSKILTLDDLGNEIAALNKYKITEIINTITAIETKTQELKQLQGQLEQINQEINSAIVKAQISGKINMLTEIAKGDSVFAGTQILTILPDNDTTYRVQIILNNMDVAKIKIGDPIKYHFQALPFREYGELNGHITKIGTDAQMDEKSGASYYYVEATLDERIASDYKGNTSQVKVGMLCEAQVITGEKHILRYLLEKIDLVD